MALHSTHEVELPVDSIEPEDNDRKQFNEDALMALAGSIEKVGLVQAIRVRPRDAGGYWLVAGERRWRAHKLLGLPQIRAIVVDKDARDAKMEQLAENKARVDLNPIEEARAYEQRIREFGETVDSISAACGVPPATIRWRLDLLKLAPEVQDLIASGQLRHTIGEALVGLDSDRQRAVLKTIGQENLNLDELWKLTERLKNEMREQTLFDPAQFELVQDEYVADAKKKNVALTARQWAALAHDLVVAMTRNDLVWAMLVESDEEVPVLVDRAKEVVDYRYRLMNKEPEWQQTPN